ncbi:hypothetical protein PTKIN_Ptkin05aG0219200 [Pterospermum kingtungense]
MSSFDPNAEAIANNYDLLTQILVCLPLKSLFRFKSMSCLQIPVTIHVIFCVVRKANDEDLYMVLHIPGKVIGYNFSDGGFKAICEFDPDDNEDDSRLSSSVYIQISGGYQYIPTLFCLRNV